MNYMEMKRVRHRGRQGARTRRRKAASESNRARAGERFSITAATLITTPRKKIQVAGRTCTCDSLVSI